MQPSLAAGMRRMINTKLQPTRVKYIAPKDQIQMWRIVRGDEVTYIALVTYIIAGHLVRPLPGESSDTIYIGYLTTRTPLLLLLYPSIGLHHKRKGKGQDRNRQEGAQELELALDF